MQITIPEKFFVALAHEDENKRIKNEIQIDEGSIPFIQGIAKQERKFLLSHKDTYFYATISTQDFKKSKKDKEN